MNLPFAIVPIDLLIGIASVSDELANRKIYYAVKEQVRSSLVSSFHLSGSVERTSRFLTDFFSASGIGGVRLIHLDVENHRAILMMENNPIAAAFEGRAQKPVDHLYRGVFAGVFSHLFRLDVDCVEHQCTAVNHRNCEFILKPVHEFDFAREEPREQLDLE